MDPREYQKLYGWLGGSIAEGTRRAGGSIAEVTRWAGDKLHNFFMDSEPTKQVPKQDDPLAVPAASKPVSKPSVDPLEGLTPEDKKWLAYGVSGEAAINTDDEFGVAASMINRMRSPDFPNTAKEVVTQQDPVWQYEAVELGNATHDPALQERLFAGDGLAKALEILNGRKYFKGQSELDHRSDVGNELGPDGKPIKDPMFHELGNYYHYGHQ